MSLVTNHLKTKVWSENLQFIKGRAYTVFSAKEPAKAILFSYYYRLIQKVFEDAQAVSKKDNGTGAWILGREKMIQSVEVGYASLTSDKDTIISAAATAKVWACKFFQSDSSPSLYRVLDSSKTEEFLSSASVSAFNHVYPKFDIKQNEPVAFSDFEISLFRVKKEDVKVDATKLDGFTFALLKVKEIAAKKWIFQRGSIPPSKLLDKLEKWGYRDVTDPMGTDLVVYLNGDQPDHMGVLQEDYRVYSKLGTLNKHSHFHPLYAFETHAIFFRKGL